MTAEVMTPVTLAPSASASTNEDGLSCETIFCATLGRRRDAAHGRDADDGVEVAPLEEIHGIAAQDAADARKQQGEDAQHEQFEHRGIEQRVGVCREPSRMPRKKVEP